MPHGARDAAYSSGAKGRGRVVWALQLIALALAAFAAPIVTYVQASGRVSATASGAYDPDFDAEYAIDGILETEWCLPDGALGHLDLSFTRSRRVNSVYLTNGHNRHYLDRAIVKARIIVLDGDRVVERHDVELPGIEPEHKTRRIELRGHRATGVRLEVTEFAGSGAALAEIRVE